MNTASTVMKNVAALSAGTIVSQVLRVIYVGLLARYVGAEGFGQITTATALVAIMILVVNFGFDTLMVRDIAADHEVASRYVTNVLFLRLLLTIGFVALLALLVSRSNYSRETNLIIGIYALTYVLDSLSGVMRSVFYGFQKMEYKTALDLGRDLLNVVVSIFGILMQWSLVAIVAVSAFASLTRLIASVMVLRMRFVRPSATLDWALCRRLMLAALPFFALVCLSVASEALVVVILSWMGDEAAVGHYGAAAMPVVTLLILPGMFMESILPVFAERLHASRDALAQAYSASYKLLLLIGLPMGVGLILVAGPVTTLIYGPDFEQTVIVMALLALQLCTMVGYVNGAYLTASNHQTLFALLRTGSVTLTVLLCLSFAPTYKAAGAAAAVAAVAVLDFVVYSLLCHHDLRLPLPYRTFAKVILSSAVMAALGLLALHVGLSLIPMIMLCAAAYAVLLIALQVISHDEWHLVSSAGPLRHIRVFH